VSVDGDPHSYATFGAHPLDIIREPQFQLGRFVECGADHLLPLTVVTEVIARLIEDHVKAEPQLASLVEACALVYRCRR
jgi:hypothetical protein